MAISLVNQGTHGGSNVGGAPAVTITAPTDGNALIACIGVTNTNTVTSITQTGATWVQAISSAVSGKNCEIWYALNVSGAGTSVTVHLSAGTGSHGINVSEWAGVATASVADGAGASSNGTSVSPATGNLTTANANDLVIGMNLSSQSSAPSAGPTNSFTGLTGILATSSYMAPAYRIVAATGTYSTGWTIGSSVAWESEIFAFKAAAAAGGTTKPVIHTGAVQRAAFWMKKTAEGLWLPPHARERIWIPKPILV